MSGNYYSNKSDRNVDAIVAALAAVLFIVLCWEAGKHVVADQMDHGGNPYAEQVGE